MALIYTLNDPHTDEVRYIGMTMKTLEDRLIKHYSECRRYTHYRANWVRSLLDQGLKPTIHFVEEVPDEDWGWYETWWIVYGKVVGLRLTNGTSEGKGIQNPSEELRQKRSESALGNKKGVRNPEAARKRRELWSKEVYAFNLTEFDLREISELVSNGCSYMSVAKAYDMSPEDIHSLRTWKP